VFNLSIIIPADGSQAALDNTLLTVLENRPAQCQVLVPHGTNYRDPYDLSDEVTFIRHTSHGLANLINAAVEASEAEIIHVLLSGSLACEGWTDCVLAQFSERAEVAAIAPSLLDPRDDRRLCAAGIRYGRGGVKRLAGARKTLPATGGKPLLVDGPLLHAAFIRRSVLKQIGGLRDDFGRHHIDTDLAARLRSAGYSCVHQPNCRVIGSCSIAPRGFHAARLAERLYWSHASHLRQAGALPCHALHVAGDLVRQLPRLTVVAALAGRICGLAQGIFLSAPPVAVPTEVDETISIRIDEAHWMPPPGPRPRTSTRRYSRTA
jgi:hypothetical protein